MYIQLNSPGIIFAGIDGGGTRTRVALAREDGTPAGFAEGRCASFADVGVESAREELRRVWAAAWESAGAGARRADSVHMGMGSVLSAADIRTNRDIALELGFASEGHVHVDNDAWNAHAGGLSGRPGILAVSGTGSVAVGRNERGLAWRSGGWGYRLRDTGSAHALGLDALVAATRDADGRGRPTTLTPRILRALGLEDIREIFRRVHHDGLSRSEVAALAPLVVAQAESGDGVATDLLRQHAEGLVEMVAAVARKLAMTQPELALAGGLILNAWMFRDMFLQRLSRDCPGFYLAEPGPEPVFGAVLLAYQHRAGAPAPPEFVKTLTDGSRNLIART